MSRNPRYDILFEPVKIGPVTAPNRFYQTPHAIGTGQQMPHTRAAMREVRAEGGWGVVNTGYCSITMGFTDNKLSLSYIFCSCHYSSQFDRKLSILKVYNKL